MLLAAEMIQLSCMQGGMVSAPSLVFHEGVAVRSGVRYVLTGFTRVVSRPLDAQSCLITSYIVQDTSYNDLIWWFWSYTVCAFLFARLA